LSSDPLSASAVPPHQRTSRLAGSVAGASQTLFCATMRERTPTPML
jgi:hypothetical protein